MTFLTYLGVTGILYSYILVLEGKAGKKIHESSRLKFLEKILVNNFSLSVAEDNLSGPLNRGDTADLHMFRILIAHFDKSHEGQVSGKWKYLVI